jgi:hypothetical protein
MKWLAERHVFLLVLHTIALGFITQVSRIYISHFSIIMILKLDNNIADVADKEFDIV